MHFILVGSLAPSSNGGTDIWTDDEIGGRTEDADDGTDAMGRTDGQRTDDDNDTIMGRTTGRTDGSRTTTGRIYPHLFFNIHICILLAYLLDMFR